MRKSFAPSFAFALAVALPACPSFAVQFDFDRIDAHSFVDPQTGVKASVSEQGLGPFLSRGVQGQGLWFTGNSREVVTVPHGPELDATDALTLRVWVWPVRFGDHQGIVWKGDRTRNPQQAQFKVSLRPEGRVEFGGMGPRGDWSQVTSDRAIPLQRWTRITASFREGAAELFFDQSRVAAGSLLVENDQGGKSPLLKLVSNDCPVELGRFQQRSGHAFYPFCGGLDELKVLCQASSGAPTELPKPPDGNPLDAARLFEKWIDARSLPANPVLSGKIQGSGGWVLEIAAPERDNAVIWCRGETDASGRFRYLLDDFCGKFDLGACKRIRCRAYPLREANPLQASDVELSTGAKTISVTVQPEKQRQVMGPVSIYGNTPRTFLTDPADQRRVYGPVLAEMRTVGVTHFDLAFGSLASVEPRNDDADPQHMDMDFYRANFAKLPEARTLVQFIRYLRSEGFTFGIRSTGFASWQVPAKTPTGASTHLVDEIAETWVAALRLLQEEGLEPTHLVPIWEPNYAPETVAGICAVTTRLARQHGFRLPVVGPYVLTTGGQSTNMLAMPDRFEEGASYTRAYLKTCGDLTSIIALEDYASGTSCIRPNLQRLWKEVIDPMSMGKARELWMIEYGAPSGQGPWNFYPSRWHGSLSDWEAAFRLARSLNQLLDGGVSRLFFWKAWDSIGEEGMITPSSCGLIKGSMHDQERRPPFHAARLYWPYLQEGAHIVGCTSDGDLAVNAAVQDRQIAVFLLNPRSQPITADVNVPGTRLAVQARLLSATGEIPYQEREIHAQASGGFQVELPPRSINTLLCRRTSSPEKYEQICWPASEPGVAYLADLPWRSASTVKGEMKTDGPDGKDVNWHRDETWTGGWIVHRAVAYRRGLSVHGSGEVQFAIPPQATSFHARMGVDDFSPTEAPVTCVVKVDEQVVSPPATIRRGEALAEISVPLSTAKTLSLSVQSKEGKISVDWIEARFVLPATEN